MTKITGCWKSRENGYLKRHSKTDSKVGGVWDKRTMHTSEDVSYTSPAEDVCIGLIFVPAWNCINFLMVLSSWRMACKVDWQLQVQQLDPTIEFTPGSSPLELAEMWGWVWKVLERGPDCPENCPLWVGSSFHAPRELEWRPCEASVEELDRWGQTKSTTCGSCFNFSPSLPTRWYILPVLSFSNLLIPVICFLISMLSSPK